MPHYMQILNFNTVSVKPFLSNMIVHYLQPKCETWTLPINHLITKSINHHSINQTITHSLNQSINQSIKQASNQSNNQASSQFTHILLSVTNVYIV